MVYKWLVISFIVLYFIFGLPRTLYYLDKFGGGYRKLYKEGKLGKGIAAPCKPNDYFMNYDTICKKCGVRLPEFEVLSCKGTLMNFAGDFHDEAKIKFETPISAKQLVKMGLICENDKEWESKFPYTFHVNDGYVYDGDLFCDIEIIDTEHAIITYGRI